MKYLTTKNVGGMTLHESDQSNCLRWTFLHKDGDTFTRQAPTFKCKDYFNDMVAAYQGFRFSMYGFDTSKMTFNDEGAYILLENLTIGNCLLGNLKIINEELPEEKMQITQQEDGSILLLIPRVCFNSTYVISLLTYLIRIAHSKESFASFEQLVNNNVLTAVDNPFKQFFPRIMLNKFKNPANHWCYLGKNYTVSTGEEARKYGLAIHNCGCFNVLNTIEREKDAL